VSGAVLVNERGVGVGRLLRRLDLADPRWDLAAAAVDLTADERARAGRGVPAVHRRRLLVRSALRRTLGDLLGLPASAVPLQLDEAGRPCLVGNEVQFSCSASEDVALIVISDSVVGVDVQRHRDEEAAAAFDEGWLAPEEQRRIAALPAGSRAVAVTRCWTQKEAVLKGRGTGIRRPPTDVVTPVACSGRVGPWWLAPVAVPAGHVASLASRAPLEPSRLDAVVIVPGGAG
jgi:4'-phosphopantetheinyl transferase